MSDASTLCCGCALCCDGALFDRVPLAVGEQVPLPVARLPTGARHLTQPCVGLKGRVCSCYGERPRTCRGFKCLLLTALEGGEVSLADALEVVARARTEPAEGRAEYLRFHFGRR